MIEFKITWHFLLLIIALVVGLILVFTLDDRDSMLGSTRFWGGVIYIIISAFVIVIYGGIFLW